MGFRSHLFFDEFGTSSGGFNSLSRSHRDHPYVSDVVDTLSDQFSSLSLLRPKPRPIPTLPSNLKSLRPNGERPKLEPYYELHLSRLRKNESQQDRAKVLRRQEERLYRRGLVHRNGNALRESVGTGVFHPLQRPTTNSVRNQSTPRPIPTLPSSLQRMYGERPKLEPYYLSRLRKNEQDRAKVLRRQEERLYKRGLVHRNGNALRESVGTGVFHPLQRPTTNSVKNQNQSNRNQSGKELLSKIKRGVMTTTRQEQQEMDECHYHLPPDMDFSKDWTF